MSYTQFYQFNDRQGMVLRSKKVINCFHSTELVLSCKKLVEIRHRFDNGPPCYKNCDKNCYFIKAFIEFVEKYHNDLIKYSSLYAMYGAVKKKIDDIIEQGKGYECKNSKIHSECYECFPIEKFKNLQKLYKTPHICQRELFFKLASRLNKDLAHKICNI